MSIGNTLPEPASPVHSARDEIPRGRDEWRGGGMSGTAAGTSGGANRLVRWIYLGVAGVVLLGHTVDIFTLAQDLARRGAAYTLRGPIIWDTAGAIVMLALLPLLRGGVLLMRRLRGRPAMVCLVAVANAVLFPTLHIVGMVLLRKGFYAVVGESYAFSWSASQFLYEFRKDILSYVALSGFFWLGELWLAERALRTAATKAPQAAASEGVGLWLRDGAISLRVDPREVVWVASAGNYIEYALADGRRHLLRGTLSGEESRLSPFGIVRVHRTRLVNLTRAVVVRPRSSGDFEVQLDTGDRIVASRRYRSALAEFEFGRGDTPHRANPDV